MPPVFSSFSVAPTLLLPREKTANERKIMFLITHRQAHCKIDHKLLDKHTVPGPFNSGISVALPAKKNSSLSVPIPLFNSVRMMMSKASGDDKV